MRFRDLAYPFTKVESPAKAKAFTVRGTLQNIVAALAPIWVDPALAGTPDGKKTLQYLLDIVSSICLLPPEGEPVIPQVDDRLLAALGLLCATEPTLCQRYVEIGSQAVQAMLAHKPMRELCLLADRIDVDVNSCETKAGIIQLLLESGKTLLPDAAPSTPNATPTVPRPEISVRLPEPDKEVLMVVFRSCGGLLWKNKVNWATDEPIWKWNGVEVNEEGRVVKLDLHDNNLTGERAHGRLYYKGLGKNSGRGTAKLSHRSPKRW